MVKLLLKKKNCEVWKSFFIIFFLGVKFDSIHFFFVLGVGGRGFNSPLVLADLEPSLGMCNRFFVWIRAWYKRGKPSRIGNDERYFVVGRKARV